MLLRSLLSTQIYLFMRADVFSWQALDPAAHGSQQNFPNNECSELNISPSSGGEIKLVISHLSVGCAFVPAVHRVIFHISSQKWGSYVVREQILVLASAAASGF